MKNRKRYEIIINYDTGDSFSNTPNNTLSLVEEWNNIEIAKENLKRIKEHHDAYKEINGWTRSNKEWEDYSKERWFSKDFAEHRIILLKDDETTYSESTSGWIGYFETFNHATIQYTKEGDSEWTVYG
jgi:hypothetical protein